MVGKNSKYLDPKNDLTFRKIFGERPHVMKSFLNSITPKKTFCKFKLILYTCGLAVLIDVD